MTVRPKTDKGRFKRLSQIVSENEDVKSFLQSAWDDNKGRALKEEDIEKLKIMLRNYFLDNGTVTIEANNKARMFSSFINHKIIKLTRIDRAKQIGINL